VAPESIGKPVLRELEDSDLFRLHEIDKICFEAGVAFSRFELLFQLKHPAALVKVVEITGEVLAFAVARILDDLTAHIITLDVLPEARRRGIGSTLMKELHREFLKRNLAVSLLEVDVENRGALKFYHGHQYETVETLRGYYSGRRDAYRMVKFLESNRPQSYPFRSL